MDDTESILQAPDMNEALGIYRLSQGSDKTFASNTTRASSVMPQAKPNLGLTEQEQNNLSSIETKSHFEKTSVGQKNKDLGFSVMAQPDAIFWNKKNKQVATEAFKAKELAAVKEVEDRKKRKKILKYGLLLLVVVMIMIVISLALVLPTNDSELDDENDAIRTSEPTVAPSPELTSETSSPQLEATLSPSSSPSVSLTSSPTPTPTELPTFAGDVLSVQFDIFRGADAFQILCANIDDTTLNFFSICESDTDTIFECSAGNDNLIDIRQGCVGCTCESDVVTNVLGNDFCSETFCETNFELSFQEQEDKDEVEFFKQYVETCQTAQVSPLPVCVFDEIILCIGMDRKLLISPNPTDCDGFQDSCSEICVNNEDFCEVPCLS